MAIEGLEKLARDPRFWQISPEEQEQTMEGIYGAKWKGYSQVEKNTVYDYMANTWGPPKATPRMDISGKVVKGVKSFLEEPSIVGGTAVGMATQKATGAGVGGALGEASEIITEGLAGQQQTIKTPMGTIEPPKIGEMNVAQATAAQAGYVGKRIVRAFFIEALADKAGELLVKAYKGAFRAGSADPFKRKVAQEALVTNQYWTGQEGHLPLASLYPEDAYAMQTAHKFAVGSFTGGGAAARNLKTNILAEAGTIDDYLNVMAEAAGPYGNMNVKEAGSLVTDLITGGRKVSAAMEKELFGVVDKMNQKGVTVSLDSFDRMLNADTAMYTKMNQRLAGDLKAFRDGVSKTVQDSGTERIAGTGVLEYNASFSEAQFLRSRLLAIKEVILESKDGHAISLVNKWISTMDQAMETAGKELDPTAFTAYRKANNFVVKNRDAFYNDLAGKVISGKPGALEKVAKDVFKLNDANAVRQLRVLTRRAARMTGKNPVEAWKGMQSQYMLEMFDQFSIEAIPQAQVTQKIGKQIKLGEKGLLRSEDLLKHINGRHTKPVFDEIFKNSPVARGNFIQFLKASSLYKTHAAGGAMMVIQLAQGGAVAALPSGKVALKDVAGLFIVPWAMSKALHSKGFTKWLVEGMKTPANTGRALTIKARLAYYVAMADVPMITPTEPTPEELVPAFLGEITLQE